MDESLPISLPSANKAVKWLKTNFLNELQEGVKDTPFSIDVICGIACQETAVYWLDWINKYSPQEILLGCVFDTNGDYPEGTRKAFPKNQMAFREKYGNEFTESLISSYNVSRKMRDFKSQKPWLGKGYGIFQYDLQNILPENHNDEVFFRNKLWGNMKDCMTRLLSELNKKWKIKEGDLYATIRSYNGSGQAATNYANNVMKYIEVSKQVVL